MEPARKHGRRQLRLPRWKLPCSRDGQIADPQWQKGSGDSRWDNSVREAIAAVTSMDRPPPTNFPPRVTIRFDVQQDTEPVLQ